MTAEQHSRLSEEEVLLKVPSIGPRSGFKPSLVSPATCWLQTRLPRSIQPLSGRSQKNSISPICC